jgi:hypothetical protein
MNILFSSDCSMDSAWVRWRGYTRWRSPFLARCVTPAIIDEERGPTDTEKLRELLFSRRVRFPKAVGQLRT